MTSDQQASDLKNSMQEECETSKTVVQQDLRNVKFDASDTVSAKTFNVKDTPSVQDSFTDKVHKSGSGLNPNANAFHSAVTPTVLQGWQPVCDGSEVLTLTNGDLTPDDAGAGFSSGESPLSESPPAPLEDGDGLAPEFVPRDPTTVMPLVVGAEADETGMMVMDGGTISAEQQVLEMMMDVGTIDIITQPITNGFQVPSSSHMGLTEEGGPSLQHGHEASSPPKSEEELRKQLLAQLEYYFSRVNLVQDHYLQSQMDGDQYVPIATIANFNQVVKLTRDQKLIVDTLRSSKLVQVDETGTKVRPKHNRTVLMLREIPETTPKSEVEALFRSDKCPKVVSCEFAHNSYWYITFETDEDASNAFLYLRRENIKFNGQEVMARIKAKPLVRGSTQFPPKANTTRQHQDTAVPNFLRQQQPQYPTVLAPHLSPQFSQQQVPQAIPPYMFNFNMLPQWGAPNTTAPFLDPGASVLLPAQMLAMNGYQATSIKPSTNHSRNMYSIRNNSRGMSGKPHLRPQSVSTDKISEGRSMERVHSSGGGNVSMGTSSTRAGSRNGSQHVDSHPQSNFSRSRSEGSANGTVPHFVGPLHSAPGGSLPLNPLVPGEDLLPPVHQHHQHVALSQAISNKSENISQPKRSGGNYRRSRRNEEGSKNSRPNNNNNNPNHINKENKPFEPHFELEPQSFPPLPGSSNNSSAGDTPDGSKLSDVVKGTARPYVKAEEKVKNTSVASAAYSQSLVTSSSSSSHSSVASAADSATAAFSQAVSASPMSSLTAVSASVTSVREFDSTSGSTTASDAVSLPFASLVSSSACTIAAEQASHTSKTSKTTSQQATNAKSVGEASSSPKQATVNATTTRPATTAIVSALGPGVDMAPARLSYAQMVARKQQAEIAAKQLQNNEDSPQPNAAVSSSSRSAAQPATTLREHSQTQAPVAVSASSSSSTAPKSASASARQPSKEPALCKDLEGPKEQRFQTGRRLKENRDARQPARFDRRRSDNRDVRLPSK